MNRDGYEFDLITQRFLINRWETELGKAVYDEIIDSIKRGGDVRGVLDRYVLDHPENQDPYAHPHYPKDAMGETKFWVLTQDDLRGIQIYNENFPENSTFEKKSLNYAIFHGCNLNSVNFEQTSLTNCNFDECQLKDTCFAMGGGYRTKFISCNLTNVCFTQTYLEEVDFSDSILTGAYFEKASLIDMKVNYSTVFDEELNTVWSTRVMPKNEIPEILKSIRIAYEKAEIWTKADLYLFLERKKYRKVFLWDLLISKKSLSTFTNWFVDWLWGASTGYGVKPVRILLIGLVLAIFFALTYFIVGNPGNDDKFVTSLYYSLTTFATLGYGDIHYPEARWIMRLVSTVEALTGAIVIATFVAVMSRKVVRH